ncbi:ABC transporter ATP-binding protein/permease [Paraburkholderia mimosarum]|uniref:ABC transporter ATP-binding protein/permease n=1 Tax=Paraburkholderia mimosarum TaxID=312026 RepID=UPI00040A4D4F|nr:ATP-binding cassette domain-containing protein [Paraburkholderia mimosarum]
MQAPQRLTNPRDYSINGRFFRRIVVLSRPYWTRPGAWRSWLVLGVTLVYSLFQIAAGARLSFLTKQMADALVSRHELAYWHLFALVTLAGLLIENGLLSQLSGFASGGLTLHWRAWLTRDLVQRYLLGRTYYRIEQDGDVDNVDQRIQQEAAPFCDMVTSLPYMLLSSFGGIGIQGWILSTISPALFYGVLAYAALNAVVTWLLYRPMIRLNFDSTVAEADLRFGILHVREHAETVALYRGEQAENLSIASRLTRAVRIALATLRYQFVMGGVSMGVGLVWTLMPVLVLVPLYFSGKISFGVIAQGTTAAGMLLISIEQFTSGFMPMFARAAPHVVRLAQIAEKSAAVAADRRDAAHTITFHEGHTVRLEHLGLMTPGRERTLLDNVTLDIRPGGHVLITGRTGVGKSSLLRAMAGLWREGSGSITMPPAHETLYLPQRPYMLLGSLREQILYPATGGRLSDIDLQTLLDQVSLPDVARLHGGFDAVIDWSRVLSLGEQQRIGFARALAARPRYVFLDEATSAVDVATEQRLYAALQATGATCVSVGHRPSLYAYHPQVLDLQPQGCWRLISRAQAREEAASLRDEDMV